ncbi:MAG TPA: oligosaccharide flippase family protein [Anaerolineales bacterium]|nr:oligosaccharide flippase family protein [Anaerolineales bacterium]
MFHRIRTSLREDNLFHRVLTNSLHLFSNNTIALALSVLQGALMTRLLGPSGFGLLGIIMFYASTINSVFSFRMSELVVRYGGEYLEKGEKNKASALMKAAALTELFVSILAFIIVAVTVFWAEANLAKTSGIAWMFTVYAVGLLANFNTETATGILQVTNKIKLQGTVNLLQSVVTTIVIVAAFLTGGTLQTILFAYLLSKTILGLGMFIAAQIQLQRVLGGGWWRESFSVIASWRELIRFAVSSNVSATIIKIFRESEILWVGFFLSTTAAGYYRVAYTLVSFLSIVTDPLIASTFPEINRLVVQSAWARLKDFLRKVTSLSFAYNIAIAIGFVLFGKWMISIYSGEGYLSAYPAMIALVIGLAFNYTLFWNRPLLLSLGLPEYPIKVTLIVGLIKIALAFVLVPRFGIVAAGALLSFYYVASVGVMAWRGVKEIRRLETGD